MSAKIGKLDFRPAAVDVHFRPGSDVTWRVNISEAGITPGTVAVVVDGVTLVSGVDTSSSTTDLLAVSITLSDTQTTAIGDRTVTWSLSNTLTGVTVFWVTGHLIGSTSGNTATAGSTTIVSTAGTATLTTLVGPDSVAAITAHIDDADDAHAASAIGFTPAGTIAADDAQAAIAEVATDAASALSSHESDTTSIHGIADTSALLDTGDIGVSVQAHSAVLDATTSSFTTADETKLDGIETGATADQSAAEILAALLTVDGAGSGLDADLLDGNSSAAFEAAGAAAAAVSSHNSATTSVHGIADTAALATTAAVAAGYQPLDSDLTAIAALTTTSFGRGLLALAGSPALRASAGITPINVSDYAVGDGVADDTAAVQAALDAAETAGAACHFADTYKITGEVTVMCDVTHDAGASIVATGITSGPAVTIAPGASILTGAQIELPPVMRSAIQWTAGVAETDIGVRVERAQNCRIFARTIDGFATGLDLSPDIYGCVHNQITVGDLNDNGRQVRLYPRTNGWVNENWILLQRASLSSGLGTAVSGVRQIKFDNSGSSNLINNNHFFGSIEGDVAEYELEVTGVYNIFHQMRFECTGGAQVWWRSSASLNRLDGGYAVESIVHTNEAGASYNMVVGAADLLIQQTDHGVVRAQNGGSGSYPVFSVYPTSSTPVNARTSEWVIGLGEVQAAFKAAGDTQPRVAIAPSSGTVSWGAGGVAAVDTNLYRSSADTLKTDDALVVSGALTLDSVADIGTPATNDKVLIQDTSGGTGVVKYAAVSTLGGSGDLLAANNLSDVANAATALSNLGGQPSDTDLTAIAALVSAADKVPYATGAGTWALTDFTAAGRALVDDADASAQRTTLGLVIGTNVQAHSAALDAVSGTNTGDEPAASLTVAGVVELATVAETDTGTDATRATTPAGIAGSALQLKVNGIEAGATANSSDATLLDRANHTGTQAAGTITGLAAIATSGSASDLASGTAPTARLGSGVADATTFLRGDSTWAAPAGGGDMLKSENLSGLANYATARTNLGLAIGTNVQAHSAALDAVSGTNTGDEPAASLTVAGKVELATVAETDTGTDATRAVTPAGLAGSALQLKVNGIAAGATVNSSDATLLARANHTGTQTLATISDAGTIASQSAAAVSITGGSVTGITDLAVADGGTGASDAATARTNLGLSIGTTVQAYDADLAAIAALTPAQGAILYYNGSAWTNLAAGTSGQYLQTQGAAANPIWATASGTGDLLAANNLSDVASIATARSNLRIDKRTTVSNADYTILATDKLVDQIGTMSAARTLTLPAASALNAGQELLIGDSSGTVTATNNLIVARAGSDTIDGQTADYINIPYGFRRFVSDGTSKWKTVGQTGADVTLEIVSATTSIANSSAEGVLFTYTLAKNGVRAGDELRLALWGDALNDSGASRAYWNYLKLGGSAVIAHTSASLGAASERRRWKTECVMSVRNAANDTQAVFDIGWGGPAASGSTSAWADEQWGVGSAATDFTAATRTIEYTTWHAVAHANLDQRILGGSLTLRRV